MTMPAGRYYVGDLCYVMHDEWDEFCNITIVDNKCLSGEFVLADGRRFATYSTYYGDGEYQSNVGTTHSVDAGLIGCIHIDDIYDTTYNEDSMKSLGAVVEFNEPFETSEKDGVIYFGHVAIDTDCEMSEEDLEEDLEDY